MIRKILDQIAILQQKRSGCINLAYLDQFLPNNPIIIEAGAHTGVDTIKMAKHWPESSIYAFEPVTDVFNKLKSTTQDFPNVKTYRLALGNTIGKQKIYVSEGSSDGSSSLLKPKDHILDHPDVLFNKILYVPTDTIDNWARKNNIKKVDLMWLDMQGYEFQALNSAKHIIKKTKLIYTEVSLKETYSKTILYSEYRKWLEKHGFIVALELLPWNDMGNVLFIKR